MPDINELINAIKDKVKEYDGKYKLSQTVGPDYYEPGNMENLDQYRGSLYEDGQIIIRVDVRGLRYCDRTPKLDICHVGDNVDVVRDSDNSFNSNNYNIVLEDGFVIGTLPADLCDVLAPLYDEGRIEICHSTISYIEKLRYRSRYAKQGILFVELDLRLKP